VSHWTEESHDALLALFDRHAGRVSHIRLQDRRRQDDAAVSLGDGDAPVRLVLRAMRDHGWPFPAMIAVDAVDDAAGWTAAGLALDYCTAALG
jgi:sugar phosphate isomerase/epimerase